MVQWIFCGFCDWLELLPWFWFYGTQLKTAFIVIGALWEKFMNVRCARPMRVVFQGRLTSARFSPLTRGPFLKGAK